MLSPLMLPSSSAATASCSMIGVAMSSIARIRPRPAIVCASARIQPTRSPPQKLLLTDPMLITVSPWRSYAATGGGAAMSRAIAAMVSSITNGVCAARAAHTSASRVSVSIRRPVGL